MPLARMFLKPRDGKKRPPLPILLPLLIGATFLTGAAITAAPTIQFLGKAAHADARYLDTIGQEAHPRFRFTAADGTIVMFTARTLTGGNWAAGDHATVYYDPAQPADARVPGAWQEWRSPLLLGMIGLVAVAVGVIVIRRWRRRVA